LNAQQRRELVRGFASELAERHGCAVDVAIHAPHREGDARNHHAHILATTRAVTEAGLGAKTDIELKDADRTKRGLCSGKHEITAIRERWAALVNEHLAAQGRSERIDHRSLAEQGEEREPTFHKGPAVTALERRAERSFVSERTREEVTERLQAAAERGRLERESQDLLRSIIDTTTQLKAALATRDIERVPLAGGHPPGCTGRVARLSRAGATSPSQPDSDQRALDLSGDLAAARRDAREQWLSLREQERGLGGKAPTALQGAERDAP
jgi:ATP-dependent exoDNAse (exonuclease V) alpha subunit